MILEIDAGNSRLKWRVLNAVGAIERSGVVEGALERSSELPTLTSVLRVRVSSVRSSEYNSILASCIYSWLGVVPEFAQSMAFCGGVRSGYSRPESLGVDRWLAILAAVAQCRGRSVLVIDAGSALTLDFVNEVGDHLGGYIVPGLNMQVDSLLRGTSIIIGNQNPWGGVTPGLDTVRAIHNGVLAMVSQWIAVEVGLKRGVQPVDVLLTGGDTNLVSDKLNLLGVAHENVPDLVLNGLRVALP